MALIPFDRLLHGVIHALALDSACPSTISRRDSRSTARRSDFHANAFWRRSRSPRVLGAVAMNSVTASPALSRSTLSAWCACAGGKWHSTAAAALRKIDARQSCLGRSATLRRRIAAGRGTVSVSPRANRLKSRFFGRIRVRIVILGPARSAHGRREPGFRGQRHHRRRRRFGRLKACRTGSICNVTGNAAPCRVETAGARRRRLLLAVTQSDETNMVACKLAATMFNIRPDRAHRSADYLRIRDLLARELAVITDLSRADPVRTTSSSC